MLWSVLAKSCTPSREVVADESEGKEEKRQAQRVNEFNSGETYG
jgi:hypothetical protein